jgi:lysophospholipase L1-like esterase
MTTRSLAWALLAAFLAGCGRESSPVATHARILEGHEAELGAARPAILPRWDADRVAEFWGWRHTPNMEHDWVSYFRRAPSTSYRQNWIEHADGGFHMRTNGLGLREDAELPLDPDLRILVLGDSHTDGVVPNSESYANQLELLLSEGTAAGTVDVVNAGVGLYTFPNYLGATLKFLPLEPDVVIVGAFGGNDFGEVIRPWLALSDQRIEPPGEDYSRRLTRARAVEHEGERGAETLAQGFNQLAYFAESPERMETALEAAEAYLNETRAICERIEARLLVLLIPSPLDGDAETFETIHGRTAQALGLGPEDLSLNDGLADRFLGRLRDAGFETLDGREVLRGRPGAQYWRRDQHLNTEGHRLLAEALAQVLGPPIR